MSISHGADENYSALVRKSGGGGEYPSNNKEKRFDDCFKVLWSELLDENRMYPETLSFRKGNNIIWKEEGYKYAVKDYVKERFDTVSLDDLDGIAMATEVCLHTAGERQRAGNLLIGEHVSSAKKKCESHPRTVGAIVRDVLTARSNEEMKKAFEQAANFFSVKGVPMYDIVSFLFFIKDSDNFFSVRPLSYGKRLHFLGYDAECTRKCTWENYSRYIESLQDIRTKLSGSLKDDDVTLIDAESFMWMLWKVTRSETDFERRLKKMEPFPLPKDPLESREIYSTPEGAKVRYYVTRYERNPFLRKQCIAYNSKDGKWPSCICCGFNFGDRYGYHGKDFIQVHHVVPLSSRDEEVTVDPKTDLVCVCSNCHSMIHHKRNHTLSIEELQSIIRE